MADTLPPADGDDRLTQVMLAHVSEAVVVCDQAGIVVRASRVARELCIADPTGQPLEKAYPLQTVDGAVFSLPKASDSRERTRAALQLDERTVSLLLRVDRTDVPAAGLSGYVVVMTDISEHALTEDKVRSSQAELRRLLETADRSRRALLSVLEDQRQTERALSDSERQFRDLVEQSVAGIYIVQHGVLAYVNP
ncbi:MAG: hypothetical protein IT483_02595, partial [Gammaproteobacteria bacterium]|nr:hypothetical protein [Gammaproteobacteria bacterium]